MGWVGVGGIKMFRDGLSKEMWIKRRFQNYKFSFKILQGTFSSGFQINPK